MVCRHSLRLEEVVYTKLEYIFIVIPALNILFIMAQASGMTLVGVRIIRNMKRLDVAKKTLNELQEDGVNVILPLLRQRKPTLN